jgi:DMSO/TMAO reductase YedYZ heme-binding membrane subunit
LLHLTSNPIDWYATRAAGIVAYLMLTVVIVVGVGLAGRAELRGWPRFAVVEVHRFGGLLVGSFVVVHVATIAIDAFMPFSVTQLVVPFVSSYRPPWMAIGIVASELLIALAISNALRKRLPYRLWRRLHFLNFVIWLGATVHGVGVGTDSRSAWALALYIAAVGSVVAACVVRVTTPPRRLVWAKALTGGVAAAAVAGVGVLAIAPVPKRHVVVAAGLGFEDALTGRISVQNGRERALVSLAGRGTGPAQVLVRADLLVSNAGAESTSLQLEYLPGGQTCIGQVTDAASFSFEGVCRMPDGSSRTVHAQWAGAARGDTLRGTITAKV